MTTSHVDKIQAFMVAAGQYCPDTYIFDSNNLTEENIKTLKLRLSLITEEVEELFEGVLASKQFNVFKIQFQVIQQMIKLLDQTDIDYDRVAVADALTDIDYINGGTAVALKIPLEACFDAVHENNMTKIDPVTGKCLKNEQGKIIKPEGYISVSLDDVLKEHM